MKKIYLLIVVSIVLVGCVDEGYEVLPLPPVLRNKTIDDIIPSEYISVLESINFPIYRGTTPPNIVGCYLVDSNLLVASNDPNDISNGWIYTKYFGNYKYRFYSQNAEYNTLTIESMLKGGTAAGYGNAGNISGTDSVFTTYFVYEETGTQSDPSLPNYGATATGKMILVISGTKATQGIKNWVSAMVVFDKYDPNNILVPVGTIRVFEEVDGLAANTTWVAFKPTDLSKTKSISGILKCLSAQIQPTDTLTNSVVLTNSKNGGK